MTPEEKREYKRQAAAKARNSKRENNKVNLKNMTSEQLNEYWRKQKEIQTEKKRVEDEAGLKAKETEKKQKQRNDLLFKAKEVVQKQKQRDQERDKDEALYKAKEVDQKQK